MGGVEAAEVGRDFILWVWESVEDATGYEVVAAPAGTPPEERDPAVSVEEPRFRQEGINPATEILIHVRAVTEAAGGRAVGLWSNGALAETWPRPRECTHERDTALAYIGGTGGMVAEWDGTPLRIDYLPDFPSRDFIFDELDKIEAFADEIERHVGYRIVERGAILDDFDFPVGWRSTVVDYRESQEEWSRAARPLDQFPTILDRIHAVHYPLIWADGGCSEWARPRQGIIGFSTCLFTDPPPLRRWPEGTAVLHELFHVFGFDHSDTSGRQIARVSEGRLAAGLPINRMSAQLDFVHQFEGTGPAVTFSDIDVLRCIFPEGGQSGGFR